MININSLITEISNSLIRSITGKLFTEEQIHAVTSNTIGKHFSDWFPTPQKAIEERSRVEEARQHINKASLIIAEMQSDLENQNHQLEKILKDVEEKRQLAERYEILANTSQEKLNAFRKEMEESLRNELITQAEQGKRLRQIASFVVWLITLILGAALGAYFKNILDWLKSIFV